MKALLLKDCFVIFKQMKIFLLAIVIFSFLPGTSANLFAVVYAAMLPYTALAYDERSKWDQLAAAMPYSDRDIVLSKYLLGWVCIAGSMGISFLASILLTPFTHLPVNPAATVLMAFSASILLGVTLPLMFRFGVERGRMFFLFFIVAASVGISTFLSISVSPGFSTLPPMVTAGVPLLAVAINAVSIPLSIRLRRRYSR